MADRIIDRMPAHDAYVEVFCGAAWVLFRKPESNVEIINDVNKDLTNLFRCCKHHLNELVSCFKWLLVSRDQFDEFMFMPPEALTDIQRAARFYYLTKCAFGAKITSPTFGICATARPRLNLLRVEEELSAAHLRLSRVYIESKGYEEVLQRFDKAGTLFYLDPPYYGHENDYGREIFARADFVNLARLLGQIKGQFILSLNDRPEVRELFKAFEIESIQTRYSVNATHTDRVGEVLITNAR